MSSMEHRAQHELIMCVIDRPKRQHVAIFNYLVPEVREIPDELLEKYASDGGLQFMLPDVLNPPPIFHQGDGNEIIGKFGSANQPRTAVSQLESLLYAK